MSQTSRLYVSGDLNRQHTPYPLLAVLQDNLPENGISNVFFRAPWDSIPSDESIIHLSYALAQERAHTSACIVTDRDSKMSLSDPLSLLKSLQLILQLPPLKTLILGHLQHSDFVSLYQEHQGHLLTAANAFLTCESQCATLIQGLSCPTKGVTLVYYKTKAAHEWPMILNGIPVHTKHTHNHRIVRGFLNRLCD